MIQLYDHTIGKFSKNQMRKLVTMGSEGNISRFIEMRRK